MQAQHLPISFLNHGERGHPHLLLHQHTNTPTVSVRITSGLTSEIVMVHWYGIAYGIAYGTAEGIAHGIAYGIA